MFNNFSKQPFVITKWIHVVLRNKNTIMMFCQINLFMSLEIKKKMESDQKKSK